MAALLHASTGMGGGKGPSLLHTYCLAADGCTVSHAGTATLDVVSYTRHCFSSGRQPPTALARWPVVVAAWCLKPISCPGVSPLCY
jgi:hypothetical protein